MQTPTRHARTRRARPRIAAAGLLLPAALALPFLACAPARDAGAGSGPTPAAQSAPHAASPREKDVVKAHDGGDFKVAPAETGAGLSAEERDAAADEQKSLEEAAAELNRAFSLPHDILIGFGDCGEANAFYDDERKEVTVCRELTDDLYESFRGDYKTDEEVDEAVANATTFVFFHEIGHALVAAYDLPVTGREEDAVDQLSVLFLADGSEEGDQTVLDAARSFARATEAELDELAFADEHSLDRQRFYNIICLLYGKDAKKHASLVEDGTLPEARAGRCADEFARADRAWDALLAPYVKVRLK